MLKYIYDNSNVNFIDILLTDIESAFDEEISFDQLYQNLLEELSVNDYTNFYLKKVDEPMIIDDPDPIKYRYTDNRFLSVIEELSGQNESNDEIYRINNEADYEYFYYDISVSEGIPIREVYFEGNLERAILSAQKYLYKQSKGNYNLIDDILSVTKHEDNFDEFFDDFLDHAVHDSTSVQITNFKII